MTGSVTALPTISGKRSVWKMDGWECVSVEPPRAQTPNSHFCTRREVAGAAFRRSFHESAKKLVSKGPERHQSALYIVHLLLGGAGGIKIGEIKTLPNLRNGSPRCFHFLSAFAHTCLLVKLKSNKKGERMPFVFLLDLRCTPGVWIYKLDCKKCCALAAEIF